MRCIVRLVLCLYVAVTLSGDDLVITEKSFGCLLDQPKVRNTRIQNPDPAKLKEAIQIFTASMCPGDIPYSAVRPSLSPISR